MSFSSPDSAQGRRASLRRVLLVALFPAAIVILLIAVRFRAAPWHFLPIWTDEVVYWNEAAVFARAGFDGGYITVHEQTPPARFSRFGAHGPAFAIFHGSIGRIAGWQPYSAFLINLAIVSVAAFVWLRGSIAGRSRAAAILVATFWPLLLYLPTNMQEPTHFALAFLFALALERLAIHRGVRPWLWIAPLFMVAVLLRPTWALMLLPAGWARARRAGIWKVALLVAATLALTAFSYSTFDYLASPGYQNHLRRVAEAWNESPERALDMTLSRATINVRLLFLRSEDEPPEIAFRYFLVAFLAVLGLRRLIVRGDRATALDAVLLTVIPVFAIVLIVGEVESWRDFRLLSPHVFVALLLLAAHGGWERWLWIATLAALPAYVTEFRELHEERFTARHDAIAEMRRATEQTLPFVPEASPWANTVLVHAEQLQYPLLGLPAGVGVSYVADWENLPATVRSRYLLLRPEDRTDIGEHLTLEPLSETPLGTLYRNRD